MPLALSEGMTNERSGTVATSTSSGPSHLNRERTLDLSTQMRDCVSGCDVTGGRRTAADAWALPIGGRPLSSRPPASSAASF